MESSLKAMVSLKVAEEFYEIAVQRFNYAQEIYLEEDYHTAAHLFINSAILFTNFLFQKFLNRIPGRKQHSDLTLIESLKKFLSKDFNQYKSLYLFLMSHKSAADYGISFSENSAKQIKRKAEQLKEIAESYS